MENLEQIVAQNLIELRKSRGWTQAELAEKINYSDKSVSKWERGEALPDLKILTQLAELFDVTLDFLTTENATANLKEDKSELGFRIGVEMLAVCTIWLIALSLFLFGNTALHWQKAWLVLIWAVPASALVMVIFGLRWKFRVSIIVFESIFGWAVLASAFLQALIHYQVNLWHLFLIGVPMQGAVILWGQIRKQRK